MLKALELVGFKSFADKTRLEFPRGITVVVGPNGSGKSNIVDAIKWVLGEQSVKSLRGKEMADVIFNGSAARRALNAAESTLVFDNSQRTLAVDTPEVHITRRVYRSGEGEYLINRQPCRLRDIRDLLAGTGLATEAYSIIEQGKVDVLLQSSPRDRRLIFEEAAGISRFKAKKLESLRRLERVEQNLLRLSDIVEEVENRLRTVRMQASKARKYKEYSERLQALRTQIALVDWGRLSGQLQALEGDLQAMREENAQQLARAEAADAQIVALETEIAEAETSMRSIESRGAQYRERIAARESASELQRRRCRDLEEEIARHRRQLTSMNVRAGDLELHLHAVVEELSAAERENRAMALRLGEEERALTRLTTQIDDLRTAGEQRRTDHLQQMRVAAALGNQISALEAQVASTTTARERCGRRRTELADQRDALAVELARSRQAAAELGSANGQSLAQLQELQTRLAESRQQAQQAQRLLGTLRERHSGASERAAVLDELEKRLEGISPGVRQVLVAAQTAAAGPYRQVRGLVADLLHVNYETAPLVEVALGDLAQCVIVAGSRDLLTHLQGESDLTGRVGFIRLDVLPPKTHLDAIDLHAQPGVLGRADEFVETTPEFAVLARRLLGKTWIVERLSQAIALAESVGRGASFVTRAGELLAADGTLHVGPRGTASGLISRRSELRALKSQLAELAAKIDTQGRAHAALVEQIAAQDAQLQTHSAEHARLTEDLAAERLRLGAIEERAAQLEHQHQAVEVELDAAESEHAQASDALEQARTALTGVERMLADLEASIQEESRRIADLEQARARQSREAGATKIEVVKSEQRVSHLQMQRGQMERDRQERGRALADNQSQLATSLDRLRQAERDILRAEGELAELYLQKEALAAEVLNQADSRAARGARKMQLTADTQRTRGRIRKLEARLHAKDLAAGEVRHERATLADRLREDYGIELAELEHTPSAEELQERTAVEREIVELRAKLNSIGGVNLDALVELEELETRFETLSTQYRDLTSAKASLEQIINKINADSRRLFADTLEVVRGHFQSLFRKLFGGGQADIVLDEGADILDSGIEIVARPPGKEPRNISLLSGGEKTLTCVALLLAIFRSRPSPFCVLDEVDAALDEANIERFVGVLQEFLAWTQFIVVTHSKKTMTCASTLYGVTMQESGVSKRVSVRFEDVSDNGEILNVRESPQEHPPSGDETQAA